LRTTTPALPRRLARHGAAWLVAGLALTACASDSSDGLDFAGPSDGTMLNATEVEDAALEVVAEDEESLAGVELRNDGAEVEGVERDGDRLRLPLTELEDGEHLVAAVMVAEEGESDEEGEVLHEWEFAMDTVPPELELTEPSGAVIEGEPLLVAGTTEPGAEVGVGDETVTADEEGTFELEYDESPGGALEIRATDAAGNVTDEELSLIAVPSRVEVDNVRGVHVTAHAWASDTFRERIIAMIDDGIVNTVALTLKDESGEVGWNSDVQLAEDSGANSGIYDLEEVVAELHEQDVHIAGRIVAFRDGVLGEHALEGGGDEDWLIQTPGGDYYTSGGYGCCFTSFAHPEVIDYNIDLAEEAAAAGVDSILWDYIRRPDGDPDAMVIPGLADDAGGATLEEAVVDFAAEADRRLRPYGIQHGASLYGIAADRPTQIAQDVPALSEHLDYVAPMIYPSHWGPGEYDVADPNRQPYDIITATLDIWKDQTDGTRSRVVPWLEDTRYRAWDRPEQVREQIRAARDQDIHEFIMWDPNVDYTVEAYEPPDN
jgi:hypothetical protein